MCDGVSRSLQALLGQTDCLAAIYSGASWRFDTLSKIHIQFVSWLHDQNILFPYLSFDQRAMKLIVTDKPVY